MTTTLPIGGLEPIVRGAVRGWAAAGSTVRVLIDDREIGAARAVDLRLFAWRRPIDTRCGFEVAAPGLDDGADHVVRVLDAASGLDLPGSPMAVRAGGWIGRVDASAGALISGRALDRLDPERPVAVAAWAGAETLAVAIARPGPDSNREGHRFTLILPDDVLLSGARLVQVGIIGADTVLPGSPAVIVGASAEAAHRGWRRPSQARRMGIKISAPNVRVAHEWGDYHFANALKAALFKRGWTARVDCQDEWTRGEDDDVVLALRGRHRFRPDPDKINLLWQISHPDRLADGEAEDFDHIFTASDIHAVTLAKETRTPVEALHQATDPSVFRPPEPARRIPAPLLFVGNSRKEYRTIVNWCVERELDVAVYGGNWEGVIPDAFIRGQHILNEDLHAWYGSAAVVLNDHWDTMREGGFLSNRLFDASAAGAFVITDPVRGLGAVFGDTIEMVEDADDLAAKVGHYLAHPEEARAKADAARRIVLERHTFDHRAERILEVIGAMAKAELLGMDAA